MDSETQQEWVLQTPCREGLPKGWKGHQRRRSSHHRTQESRSTPEAAGYHTVEQTSSLQCQRSSSTTQKMSEMQILRLYPAAVLCCAESCPTLCDPMDCNPPGSSVHGDSPSKNAGVGCHGLLQGTFPTQGLNSRLPHCRRILYHLSHQGSPGLYPRPTESETGVEAQQFVSCQPSRRF